MGLSDDPELLIGVGLMILGSVTLIASTTGMDLPLLGLVLATVVLAVGTLLVGLDFGLFSDKQP